MAKRKYSAIEVEVQKEKDKEEYQQQLKVAVKDTVDTEPEFVNV
jgi:hypothetical protein